jgi:hypothetical protein
LINQRRAFNRHTTTKAKIAVWIPGEYDASNMYIGESYGKYKNFTCTPIAFGDRDSGITGKQLKATEVGERQPAYMQFHSRTPMPMKSIISIYGVKYKVTEIAEYAAAGFHKVIAARINDT